MVKLIVGLAAVLLGTSMLDQAQPDRIAQGNQACSADDFGCAQAGPPRQLAQTDDNRSNRQQRRRGSGSGYMPESETD